MPEFEDQIDPTKYTVKELVKHLFREVQEIKDQIADLRKFQEEQIETANKRIENLESWKSSVISIGKFVAVTGPLIGGLIAWMIKVLYL